MERSRCIIGAYDRHLTLIRTSLMLKYSEYKPVLQR